MEFSEQFSGSWQNEELALMKENKKITLLNEKEHLTQNGIEQTEEIKNRMQRFIDGYSFRIENNELFHNIPKGYKIANGQLIITIENEDDGSTDMISWEWR